MPKQGEENSEVRSEGRNFTGCGQTHDAQRGKSFGRDAACRVWDGASPVSTSERQGHDFSRADVADGLSAL